MTTTTTDLHARVLACCKRIEAASEAVELLEAHDGDDWSGLYAETIDQIAEARRTLELDELADNFDDAAEGLDGKLEDPEELLLDGPLELRVEGRFDWDAGKWEPTRCVVVICTGGPHIEAVHDGGDYLRVSGYWGGERVEGMPCHAPRAARLLDEAWVSSRV